METAIETEKLQLDQFLKWAGVVSSGGEVRALLEQRLIRRNGETESARRRKLHVGERIEIDGMGAWRVTGGPQ